MWSIRTVANTTTACLFRRLRSSLYAHARRRCSYAVILWPSSFYSLTMALSMSSFCGHLLDSHQCMISIFCNVVSTPPTGIVKSGLFTEYDPCLQCSRVAEISPPVKATASDKVKSHRGPWPDCVLVAGGCTLQFSRFSSPCASHCSISTPDEETLHAEIWDEIPRSHKGPVDRQPEHMPVEACCDEGDGSLALGGVLSTSHGQLLRWHACAGRGDGCTEPLVSERLCREAHVVLSGNSYSLRLMKRLIDFSQSACGRLLS